MIQEVNGTRKIIKNALYLYLRMFISMCIALITSRLILNTLGIENYGIYNIVGGIIVMFSFLNTTMAGATSRFITYELGKGNKYTQNIFSTALTIHFIIAIIVAILIETLGFWFLINKLVIPAERLFAAKILLQFSIITMFFNLTQVPYNASIIAYEKMDIYAIIGTLDSFLKLIIAITISFSKWDKLIIYGLLIMLEQIFITLLYRYYCTKKFNTCKFIIHIDKKYLRPMFTYSIWDIFGQGSIVIRTQGTNMLLNMFFGVAVNAATGITTQVQTLLLTFTHNIMTAFRPQIIKNYALGNHKKMEDLIHLGAKSTFLLLTFIAVPLLIEIEYILFLWLKNVPEYCVIFSRFTIIIAVLGVLTSYPMIGIDATAKIRDTSIIIGILYILVIPISYLLFKLEYMYPWIPYAYNSIIPLAIIILNSYFLNKYIEEFSFINYLKKVVTPTIVVFFINLVILNIIHYNIQNRLVSLIICIGISFIITITIGFIVCYNKNQKEIITQHIKSKLFKRHKK